MDSRKQARAELVEAICIAVHTQPEWDAYDEYIRELNRSETGEVLDAALPLLIPAMRNVVIEEVEEAVKDGGISHNTNFGFWSIASVKHGFFPTLEDLLAARKAGAL